MGKFKRRLNRNLRLRAERVEEWHPLTLDWKFQIAQTTTYSQKNVHQLRISGIIYYGTFRSHASGELRPRCTDRTASCPPSRYSTLLLFTGSSSRRNTSHHTRQISLLLSMFSQVRSRAYSNKAPSRKRRRQTKKTEQEQQTAQKQKQKNSVQD